MRDFVEVTDRLAWWGRRDVVVDWVGVGMGLDEGDGGFYWAVWNY